MLIKIATQEDADGVFNLAQQLSTSFVVTRECFQIAYERILESPSALLAIAVSGESIIGYVLGFDHESFYANGRVSWVEELMVSEEFRRQGIGNHLMFKFEEWSKERGSKLVALATRRAAAFYNAIGYTESAVYYRKLL